MQLNMMCEESDIDILIEDEQRGYIKGVIVNNVAYTKPLSRRDIFITHYYILYRKLIFAIYKERSFLHIYSLLFKENKHILILRFLAVLIGNVLLFMILTENRIISLHPDLFIVLSFSFAFVGIAAFMMPLRKGISQKRQR